MRVTRFLTVAVALTCIAGLASANLINEFEPNPVGADPSPVDIELSGTPLAAFSGWLLGIENDGYNGLVDRYTQVSGSYDANGLAVVSIPDLENPSFTFAFVDSFTGDNNTDLDPLNDGNMDLSTIGTIYDAIGIPDSASDALTMYGTTMGGQDFAYTGDEPKLAFRESSVGGWIAVNDQGNVPELVFDIDANEIAPGLFTADPEVTTFGSENPALIPEPSSLLLAGLGGLLLAIRRRRG